MKNNSSQEELITEAKTANYSKLSDLFRMSEYKYDEIDKAFRMLLSNYKEDKDNEKYFKCLKFFIKNTNVNYQSSTKGNTTILIDAIRLGLLVPSEKLIKYFKSLDSDNKLDVNLFDDNGDTCLFKLISSQLFSNDDRYELFTELISESPIIDHVNKDGHTLLSLALSKGNYFICEELIRKGYSINHLIKQTGDNLIHCAVKGKNCLCVNLIKQHFPEGIERKNAEGLFPIDIAKKEKMESIVNLLTEAKNYTQLELLGEYKKKNYVEILKALNILKQSDRLGNVSLSWNNLLVEYKMEYSIQKELRKYHHIDQLNTTKMKQNDHSNSGNNIFTSLYNKVVKFFLNEEISVDHPIVYLNNIILKYKLGNYPDIINLYNNYMMKSKKHNSYEHWLWIVSVSFILIEEFICINKISIVDHLLQDLEMFIQLSSLEILSKTSSSVIEEYLNSNQTLNQLNSLTEVIILFTCYKLSAQGEINRAKEQLQLFKDCYLNSEVKYPLQNTLKQFYSFIQIKVLYHQSQFDECSGLLNNIINDSNTNFHSKVFYYNSLGILNLKLKNYKYAEFCFRQCDKLIKTEDKKEILIQNIMNYKPCIWYNIGLCFFYIKNYEKALKIFLNAKLLKKCKPNPCLYYRIGICYLEKELLSMKRDSSNNLSDFIVRIEEMNCNEGDEDLNNNIKRNKIILKTKAKDNQNENIIEAINHFKEAIFLIKERNTFTYDVYYSNKQNGNLNDSSKEGKEKLLSYEKEVIQSSHINLLFCLTLLENWTEVIFYSNEYIQNKSYPKEIEYILNNYLIEAFVNLNFKSQAIELLKNEINNTNHADKNISVYSKLNHSDYQEIDYKIALYSNYIKISLINGYSDQTQIKDLIFTLLKLFQNKTIDSTTTESRHKPDYPPFVFSILIYYFLINNNIEDAKHLIKNRTIPSLLQ